MLTLALALVLHVQACPQRIVVTVPSTRSTTASVSLLECGRRAGGPWARPRRLPRRLRPPPRGRRHDPARHVRDRPDGLRARRRPRRAAPLPPARLRRLVGRGSPLAELQPLPARRLRLEPAVRRRQRGALARASRLPGVRGRANTTPPPPVPGRGSAIFLHVEHRAADERLRQPRTGPAALPARAPAARSARSRSVLHNFRLSV